VQSLLREARDSAEDMTDLFIAHTPLSPSPLPIYLTPSMENAQGKTSTSAEEHHAVEDYSRAISDLRKHTMRFRQTVFQTRDYGMHSILSTHVEWMIYLCDGLRESKKYISEHDLTSVLVRTQILRTWAAYLERGEVDRLVSHSLSIVSLA